MSITRAVRARGGPVPRAEENREYESMLKTILLPLLSGAAIFFGIPMLNEYSIDPCGAYDKMAVRTGAPVLNATAPQPDPFGGKGIVGMLQGSARGQVPQFRAAPQAAPPADPMVGVTCTTRYWQAMTGLGRIG
jgi:hypothetical protein